MYPIFRGKIRSQATPALVHPSLFRDAPTAPLRGLHLTISLTVLRTSCKGALDPFGDFFLKETPL